MSNGVLCLSLSAGIDKGLHLASLAILFKAKEWPHVGFQTS